VCSKYSSCDLKQAHVKFEASNNDLLRSSHVLSKVFIKTPRTHRLGRTGHCSSSWWQRRLGNALGLNLHHLGSRLWRFQGPYRPNYPYGFNLISPHKYC
jgi:hypothetical protein